MAKMVSTILYISANTDFSRLNLDKEIYKLSIQWDAEISPQEKKYQIFSLKCFIGSISYDYPCLRILDISKLDGLEQVIMHGKNLFEVYCSNSTTSVIVFIKQIRKVCGTGARSIRVNDAPYLRELEYGDCLERLDLDNTGITNIYLRKGLKLTCISLKNCNNLKQIEVPDGIYLGSNTFEGCSNLEEVTLPNDMYVLEPCVFKNCRNLTTIKGGKSIMQFFPSAIYGCDHLEYIENINFIQYTDLTISDNEWFDIKNTLLRNNKPFIPKLRRKHIDNPSVFFINNYVINPNKKHIGILIHYIISPCLWIIWSLNHQRYFLSNSIYSTELDDSQRRKLHQGTLIEFEYDKTPIATVEDSIYLKKGIKRINLQDVTILESSTKYNDIIEYYSPSISLKTKYENIVNLVESLDISKIIDSYSIKTGTGWQRRVGRDDIESYYRIAKTDYADEYIGKLLPQEDTHGDSSGCAPWDAEEESERETILMQNQANIDAEKIKSLARKKYSKTEHICTLLEKYMKERASLEKRVENHYHLEKIEEFVWGFHGWNRPEKIVELYNITLEVILNNNNPIYWQD